MRSRKEDGRTCMIVIKKSIDVSKLRHIDTTEKLVRFVQRITPHYCSHLTQIIDNTVFYLGSLLRQEFQINIDLSGIRIRGMLNEIYDIEDLFLEYDITMLEEWLRCGNDKG